jgi:hypothetical protein
VAITQKIQPPSASWVRNGANLLGFPSFQSGSTAGFEAGLLCSSTVSARIWARALA